MCTRLSTVPALSGVPILNGNLDRVATEKSIPSLCVNDRGHPVIRFSSAPLNHSFMSAWKLNKKSIVYPNSTQSVESSTFSTVTTTFVVQQRSIGGVVKICHPYRNFDYQAGLARVCLTRTKPEPPLDGNHNREHCIILLKIYKPSTWVLPIPIPNPRRLPLFRPNMITPNRATTFLLSGL